MLNKILKRRGKECPVYRPQIVVEEPRNLPVPITISYYNPNNPTIPRKGETIVNFLPKSVRWRSKSKTNEPPLKRLSPICRWYKRKRALRQLVKEREKERKGLKRKRQEDFEEERLRDFVRWEQLKSHKTQYDPPARYILPPSPVIQKRSPVQNEKVLYIKETPMKSRRTKSFKKSKSVAVTKFNHRETITTKFVNCCYRLCCQFYCYLTCIILIIFSVICLI